MDDLEPFALRTVFWKRLDVAGLERCTLWHASAGWSLEGAVLLERPLLDAGYTVRCDGAWNTRSVSVRVRSRDGEERQLALTVDGAGQWQRDGSAARELHGLVDVDLMITPATNTLPLRRLDLDIGASAEVTAAWVRFPELTVQRLAQRYTRLSIDRYRYESPSFTAELLVDDAGLVRRYGDLWTRCGEPK